MIDRPTVPPHASLALLLVLMAAVATMILGCTPASPGPVSVGLATAHDPSPRQETPTPSPTLMTFDGLYLSDFERADFVRGTHRCPGAGVTFWLEPNEEFNRRYNEIRGDELGVTVHVRFRGTWTPPGAYGHLGAYPRAVQVGELLEMERVERCNGSPPPSPIPDTVDLEVESARWAMRGFNGVCVPEYGPAELEVCVANHSALNAVSQSFIVRAGAREGADRWPFEWRVDGLGPAGPSSGTRCLPPQAGDASFVVVDADDDVVEASETNNRHDAPRPTLTPPPICTAGPEPTATPTVTATPTATGSVTATPCPQATPERLAVEPVVDVTLARTHVVRGSLGNGDWIEVESPQGKVRQDISRDFAVEVPLRVGQENPLTVRGHVRRVELPSGCVYGDYMLTATRDRTGQPLVIRQAGRPDQPYAVVLPYAAR